MARLSANVRNEYKTYCFDLLEALASRSEAHEEVIFLHPELTVAGDPFID